MIINHYVSLPVVETVQIEDSELASLLNVEKNKQLVEERPHITRLWMQNQICREVRVTNRHNQVQQSLIREQLNVFGSKFGWPELQLDGVNNHGNHYNRMLNDHFNSPTLAFINRCLPTTTSVEIDEKDAILREMISNDPNINLSELQTIAVKINAVLAASRGPSYSPQLKNFRGKLPIA